MLRPRLRLATLALLIVVIALATALLVQQRRETALKLRVQALEEETARDRLIFGRLRPPSPAYPAIPQQSE